MKFIPTKKTNKKKFLYQYNQKDFKKYKIPLKLLKTKPIQNNTKLQLSAWQEALAALAVQVVRLQQASLVDLQEQMAQA